LKSKSKTKTTTTTVDTWISLGCTAEKSIPNSSAEDPRFGAKDAGDDDVYLRLQRGKGFHNLVYTYYVKYINPASKA
jgi:hypothetical protein